jgi:hypothetical protein
VNLALATGASIRVDGALLDDVRAQAVNHRQWEDFPASTGQLAAEARQWMTELLPPGHR